MSGSGALRLVGLSAIVGLATGAITVPAEPVALRPTGDERDEQADDHFLGALGFVLFQRLYDVVSGVQ